MNTHADKTPENKSQSVANTLSKKQIDSESTFQFIDNRPEAVAQRKLQDLANNYLAQQQNPIQKKENKTGLPDNLKTGIENLSGYSMDDVKVHYNSDKPAQLNAHAYAQGTDIHIASGQEKHLPHEAWHVIQQKQGRVKPTMQMKGEVNINDDTGLEKEADVMGAKAMAIQLKNHETSKYSITTNSSASITKSISPNSPVQRLRTVDQWKADTYVKWKLRKAIARIDNLLDTYNNSQNLVNIDALIAELRVYIAEKEANDPTNARLAPAKSLLADALQERPDRVVDGYNTTYAGHAVPPLELNQLSRLSPVTTPVEIDQLNLSAIQNAQIITKVGPLIPADCTFTELDKVLTVVSNLPNGFHKNTNLERICRAGFALKTLTQAQIAQFLAITNPTNAYPKAARPSLIATSLKHDGLAPLNILNLVDHMANNRLGGGSPDQKSDYVFNTVNELRGHVKTNNDPTHNDEKPITDGAGTKTLAGPEIEAHVNESIAAGFDPATQYPNGTNYKTRTINELWNDCNLDFAGGTVFVGESNAQKLRRQKMALAELIAKNPTRSAAIRNIFAYKQGAEPRPFVSIVHEDAYLAPAAHTQARHTIGGANMPNKAAVAMRALTKVPACAEVASAFDSVAAANSAVATALVPYWATNPWPTLRSVLTTGGTPATLRENMGGIKGVAYRKTVNPAIAGTMPHPLAKLYRDDPIDVVPVDDSVALTYQVTITGITAFLNSSTDPNAHGWGIVTAYPQTVHP